MVKAEIESRFTQPDNELTQQERTDVAILLLKDLNPLQEKANQEGFGFLTYLLRMAIMEAQAVASGSSGEPETLPQDSKTASN